MATQNIYENGYFANHVRVPYFAFLMRREKEVTWFYRGDKPVLLPVNSLVVFGGSDFVEVCVAPKHPKADYILKCCILREFSAVHHDDCTR